jgi:DNA-directed RNA polymerase specialized sigma24 family protein
MDPKPTDAEIATAYALALSYAKRRAPGPDELTECAIDAATDGVMWAIGHYSAEKAPKGFLPFAAAAVSKWVWRKVSEHAKRHAERPGVVSFDSLADDGTDAPAAYAGEWLEDNKRSLGNVPLPAILADLPDDLLAAVRFFYVDKYDLRECGLLLGCEMETVRRRLKAAADILGDDLPARARRNGEKRMVR